MGYKKCFVVKLDTVIENPNATILGALKFKLKPTGSLIRTVIAMNTSEPVTYKILGTGSFLNNTGVSIGKEITTSNGLILSDDVREILMTDKYKLTQFRGVESNMSLAILDLETLDLKYCPLKQLLSGSMVGDLANLPTSITRLTISSSLANGVMTGDFTPLLADTSSSFDGYISVVSNNDFVSCDISKMSFEKQNDLLRLVLNGINVKGEITDLNFKNLELVLANFTLLKGDIKCFNSSKIKSIEATSAELTGNVALLPESCTLVRLSNKSNLTYNTVSTVNRTNMVILHRVSMDTNSIDRYLQDMALLNKPNGSTLGILLYGTRTSVSDTAVNTLIAKGVAVTLN